MIGKSVSHYQILEQIGGGGMGVVYKAQDLKLNRLVALKFLPAAFSLDPDAKKRFTREACTASSLDHPNICTIYEIDEAEDGQIFIAMAYYKGVTLKNIIKKGPMELEVAVDIAMQITDALSKANRARVIHRDIKPANIIITEDNTVKIIDFGLAKFIDDVGITKSKTSAGTTAYMSPQQICAEAVDQRTDIWSIGVILYEMITGKLPFKGEYEQALIYSILSEEHKPVSEIIPDIPSELDLIIARAIKKDPRFRYQKNSHVLADLSNLKRRLSAKDEISHKIGKVKVRPNFSILKRFYYKNRLKLILTPILIVLVFLSYITLFQNEIARNVILLDNTKVVQVSNRKNQSITDMYEYLLFDDLLQSSNNNVLNRREFELLNPEKKPELEIRNKIYYEDYAFKIEVSIIKSSASKIIDFFQMPKFLPLYKFYDESMLLNKIIPDITSEILQTEKKKTTFTKNWDAFVHFYKGERAWQRLELPKAKEYFKTALNIDPNFVLAKLRLANVLVFEASNLSALRLISSIRPSLGLLSQIDSLKAEALFAQLHGKVHDQIDILKKIYNRYPLRKEFVYEVAEAYYRICDIDNAIDYYRKALDLDNKYSLAHNHLAYCYSHLGIHDEALEHFRIYLSLDKTANAYDSMGDGFMFAGDLDSASWALEKGIKKDPKLSYLYSSLFDVRIRQGRFKEAGESADAYIKYAYGADSKAMGLFFKAFLEYSRNNIKHALRFCQMGLTQHDSEDIVLRNHELHWLIALIHLRLNSMDRFNKELEKMKKLIESNNISHTNYRIGILKYYHHLEACLAAKEGDLQKLMNIVKIIDGQLRDKIADRGARSYDVAFFNTSFGAMMLEPTINRPSLAKERFERALDYNPNYALAHYHLHQHYKKQKNNNEAIKHWNEFNSLWSQADPIIKKIYGLDQNIKK